MFRERQQFVLLFVLAAAIAVALGAGETPIPPVFTAFLNENVSPASISGDVVPPRERRERLTRQELRALEARHDALQREYRNAAAERRGEIKREMRIIERMLRSQRQNPGIAPGPNVRREASSSAFAARNVREESVRFPHRPVAFVENRGQWDARARFAVRMRGVTAWLEREAITFAFERHDAKEGFAVRLAFQDVSPATAFTGEEERPGRFNFFSGSNGRGSQSNVRGYAAVRYRGLYPGVDLRFREEGGTFEYDVLFSPYASLDQMTIRAEGAEWLDIADDGSLLMHTAQQTFRQRPPVAWYELPGGKRETVEARFALLDGTSYRFTVPDRNPARALVIDPQLDYATFLGGEEDDYAWATVKDAAGASYITGETASMDFPVTIGAYDRSYNGGYTDIFVTKIAPDGRSLIYSTFIGGDCDETGRGIAVAGDGAVTITGSAYYDETCEVSYPTTSGAYDRTHNGWLDAVVTKLNAQGSALAYSTFIGGGDDEQGESVALDQNGAAVVTGWTYSDARPVYPTTSGAYDTTHNGSADAFVTRMSVSGGSLAYSSFLGGWDDDTGEDIVLDGAGTAYLTGGTYSDGEGGTPYPTKAGSFDTLHNGFSDAFVTKVRPSTALSRDQQMAYSTFLGGEFSDYGYGITLYPDGPAVTGETDSDGAGNAVPFPITSAAFDATHNGYLDGFVVIVRADVSVHPSSAQLVYATFLGGDDDDQPRDITADSAGTLYLTGATYSDGRRAGIAFPTTDGAFDPVLNSSNGSMFVTRLQTRMPGQGQLGYSTVIEGRGTQMSEGIALDPRTNAAAVAGGTDSDNFPVTPAAPQGVLGGGRDAVAAQDRLLPDGVRAYGTFTPCDGRPLVAAASGGSPRRGNFLFALSVTNARPNDTVFLGVGTRQIPRTVLAGMGLYVDPASLVASPFDVRTDATGYGLRIIPLGTGLIPGTRAYVQFLAPSCRGATDAFEITIMQ